MYSSVHGGEGGCGEGKEDVGRGGKVRGGKGCVRRGEDA